MRWAAGILAAAVGLTCAAAQPEQGSSPVGDQRAQEVLQRFSVRLRQARRVSVDIRSDVATTGSALGNRYSAHQRLASERPDRLSLQNLAGALGQEIECDGRMVRVVHPQSAVTIERPWISRMTLEEVLRQYRVAPAAPQGRDLNVLLEAVVSGDAYEILRRQLDALQYIGAEVHDGRSCHRLRGQVEKRKWELWLTDEEAPVLAAVDVELPSTDAMSKWVHKMTVRFANWSIE